MSAPAYHPSLVHIDLGAVTNLSSYPIFMIICHNLVSSAHCDLKKQNLQIHENFPEDGEHDSLASVRYELGLQSTAEQTQQSILSHDVFGSSKVSDPAFVNLSIRLDDAQGV